MSLVLNKSTKRNPTSAEAAFHRLIKKIEKFQGEIKKTETSLNEGLDYYYKKVHLIEEKMLKKLQLCIPIFYSYYKHRHSKLSRNESKLLKILIQSLIRRLIQYVMPYDLNEKIIEIIDAIEGIDFKELLDDSLQSLKKDLLTIAKQQNLDIDLSKIDMNGPKKEIKEKLQQAIFEVLQHTQKKEDLAKKNKSEKVKNKTKHQLQKEQHAREIEEIQKKGLSKIYKQLAKVLHPDLEIDPLAKAEKQLLMKKLTAAYEEQDLHALLSLEMAWMNRTALNENENFSQETEKQIHIYNSILKEQVKSLEIELNRLFIHPKYSDMHHIIGQCQQTTSIVEILQAEEEELRIEFNTFSSTIIDLKDKFNFRELKRILKSFSSSTDIFEKLQAYLI